MYNCLQRRFIRFHPHKPTDGSSPATNRPSESTCIAPPCPPNVITSVVSPATAGIAPTCAQQKLVASESASDAQLEPTIVPPILIDRQLPASTARRRTHTVSIPSPRRGRKRYSSTAEDTDTSTNDVAPTKSPGCAPALRYFQYKINIFQ